MARHHADAVERIRDELLRTGRESVLFQQMCNDVEIHVVAEACRRIPRHRRRDFREKRFQILTGELTREALFSERGARGAAEIRAMTRGTRGVIDCCAAGRLGLRVHTVGHGSCALLSAGRGAAGECAGEDHDRGNEKCVAKFGIRNLEFGIRDTNRRRTREDQFFVILRERRDFVVTVWFSYS